MLAHNDSANHGYVHICMYHVDISTISYYVHIKTLCYLTYMSRGGKYDGGGTGENNSEPLKTDYVSMFVSVTLGQFSKIFAATKTGFYIHCLQKYTLPSSLPANRLILNI